MEGQYIGFYQRINSTEFLKDLALMHDVLDELTNLSP